MTIDALTIPAFRLRQPIGEYYLGLMRAHELVSVAYADVRELEQNQLDRYIGINRRLDPKRVANLQRYVSTFDATFPTNVILAVPEENASFDSERGLLTLGGTADTPLRNAGKIIDGQHRIAGLEAASDEADFEVSVAIFVGADVATQANIFATVNLAQTKVNRSLAYDLLEYDSQRSPQKSAHDIAVALDQMEGSPLYRRIKRLGTGD